MNILFVLEYYHPHIGGVETLFKSLVDDLIKRGHHVTVLTNQFDKSLPKSEKKHNLKIKRYPFYNRYFFTLLAVFPALWLSGGKDIIHTTSYNAALPAWIAAKLRRKKIVITFHEVWGNLWWNLPGMDRLSKVLHYTFERFIVNLSYDRLVAVSNYTKTSLLNAGKDNDKLTVVYNGVDYADFDQEWVGSQGSTYVFTFFGRASYSKGLDILISAANSLYEKHSNFRLQIITQFDNRRLYSDLRESMDNLKSKSVIQFMEHQSRQDLHDIISSSDAVVIPSYSEGFCFAAVESMAIGAPLITSGRGALKEVVAGRYIHSKEFSSDGLADAMYQAIKQEWYETESKYYNLDETVDEYISLYKALLV